MFEQGDILLAPFPFTDLSSVKQRPVLVLSSQEFNQTKQDIITCGITSNLQDTKYSVHLTIKDLTEGTIPVDSKIKPGKIFTIHQKMIKKKIGRVKEIILKRTYKKLAEIMRY